MPGDPIEPEDFARVLKPVMEQIARDVRALYDAAAIPEEFDRARIALPAIFDEWYALLREAKPSASHEDCTMLVSGFLMIARDRYEQMLTFRQRRDN